MTGTTRTDFGANTEALEVAQTFSDSIRGKTVLVTGVNRDGIGFAATQALASQSPANVILAGRNPQRLEVCVKALQQDYPNVNYRTLQLDLSSQKGVRAGAQELLSWTDIPTIDILVNNAAIMNLPERQMSEDGIELTFATNYVGHFLFTCLIMPKILKAAEFNSPKSTRIINVTSLSPIVGKIRWSDINFDKINDTLPEDEQPVYDQHTKWGIVDPQSKSYLPIESYHQSKTANMLFSIALNKRFSDKGIISFACHPGIIRTELSRYASKTTTDAIDNMALKGDIIFKTQGAGASTITVAALDPKLDYPTTRAADGKENYGVYFIDCQISDQANSVASSSELADRLWGVSEDLVKEKFSFN